MVVAVIDQLRQFGEARRGWLGVRIQEVTDEIGESLSIKPVRGALVGKVDDKGPAKPAGIESGDVIVKFDGKDIKVMKDLPRIVADTPVGKEVDVILIRKGKEQIKKVMLGRLEDDEKLKEASLKIRDAAGRKDRHAEGAGARPRRALAAAAHALQGEGDRQGRGHHLGRRQPRRSRQAAEPGRRDHGSRAGSGRPTSPTSRSASTS